MRSLLASITLFGFLLPAVACGGPAARSERSFDQIAATVAGQNAAEVLELLGEPDSRQPIYLRDERWIWWNYTFLAGNDYPPEVRGQVVHLEITFRPPPAAAGRQPYSQWRIAEPFGVSFRPAGDGAAAAVPATASTGTVGR